MPAGFIFAALFAACALIQFATGTSWLLLPFLAIRRRDNAKGYWSLILTNAFLAVAFLALGMLKMLRID